MKLSRVTTFASAALAAILSACATTGQTPQFSAEPPKPTGALGDRYVVQLDNQNRLAIWAERNNCTADGYLVTTNGIDVMLPTSREKLSQDNLNELQAAWIKAYGARGGAIFGSTLINLNHSDVENAVRQGLDPFNVDEKFPRASSGPAIPVTPQQTIRESLAQEYTSQWQDTVTQILGPTVTPGEPGTMAPERRTIISPGPDPLCAR